jgi:hypothetical protein
MGEAVPAPVLRPVLMPVLVRGARIWCESMLRGAGKPLVGLTMQMSY